MIVNAAAITILGVVSVFCKAMTAVTVKPVKMNAIGLMILKRLLISVKGLSGVVFSVRFVFGLAC